MPLGFRADALTWPDHHPRAIRLSRRIDGQIEVNASRNFFRSVEIVPCGSILTAAPAPVRSSARMARAMSDCVKRAGRRRASIKSHPVEESKNEKRQKSADYCVK
jgi:hypothetical protein